MEKLIIISTNFVCIIGLVYSWELCTKLPILRENSCNYECRSYVQEYVYCNNEFGTALKCNLSNPCPLGSCQSVLCISPRTSACNNPHISTHFCFSDKGTDNQTPDEKSTKETVAVINNQKPDDKPDSFNGNHRYEVYQPYIFSLVLALIPLVMFLVYRITRYAMQLQIDAREAIEPPAVNPRALNRSYSQRRQSSSRSSVYSGSRSPRHSISRSPNQSGARSPIRRSPNHLAPNTNYDTLRVEAPTILIIQPRRGSPEVPTDLPPPYSAVEFASDRPPSYTEAMEIIEKSKPTD